MAGEEARGHRDCWEGDIWKQSRGKRCNLGSVGKEKSFRPSFCLKIVSALRSVHALASPSWPSRDGREQLSSLALPPAGILANGTTSCFRGGHGAQRGWELEEELEPSQP